MNTIAIGKTYVEKYKKEIAASYEKEVPEYLRHPRMWECWQAGCFLNSVLRFNGATEEEVHAIGFAHGQRSAFGDTWEWAIRYANEYEENKKVADKPGEELADEINKEVFG